MVGLAVGAAVGDGRRRLRVALGVDGPEVDGRVAVVVDGRGLGLGGAGEGGHGGEGEREEHFQRRCSRD